MDYAELVKQLRNRRVCIQNGGSDRDFHLWDDAANAIELLNKLYHSAEDDHETMRNAYIAEVEKHRWIPVTERLPEPGKYLVLKTSELSGKPWYYWQVVSYANNLNKVDKYDFPGKEYKRPGWYSYDSEYGHYETGDEITHWMPLPTPPKEDTE